MSEQMPSDSEREAPGDLFQNLEATIEQLRTAATPPPAPPQSWLKKTVSGAALSSHQGEFNHAVVTALAQIVGALRDAAASQEERLKQMAGELSELRNATENVDAFRQHLARLEDESRALAVDVRGLRERSAALEAELAQARDFQGERIQHLLDEQRVCIRQLSLQASEEAVLADRARRATELKLDELARRVPPPPA
jgi:TolA-binding protein